jgi:hypothetical protein
MLYWARGLNNLQYRHRRARQSDDTPANQQRTASQYANQPVAQQNIAQVAANNVVPTFSKSFIRSVHTAGRQHLLQTLRDAGRLTLKDVSSTLVTLRRWRKSRCQKPTKTRAGFVSSATNFCTARLSPVFTSRPHSITACWQWFAPLRASMVRNSGVVAQLRPCRRDLGGLLG